MIPKCNFRFFKLLKNRSRLWVQSQAAKKLTFFIHNDNFCHSVSFLRMKVCTIRVFSTLLQDLAWAICNIPLVIGSESGLNKIDLSWRISGQLISDLRIKFCCLQIFQKVNQILDRFLPYEARTEICQKIGWPFGRFEDTKNAFLD